MVKTKKTSKTKVVSVILLIVILLIMGFVIYDVLYGNIVKNTIAKVIPKTVICNSDFDCSDGSGYSNNTCINPGQSSAYCNHSP